MNNKRFKALVLILAVLALGSILLAACSRPGSSTANNSNSSSASGGGGGGSSNCPSGEVHMNVTNFVTNCVTVSKGSMLKLVDDGAFLHQLANGSWVNGNAQPATENGAPTVNLTINSGTKEIGPFNTAGTLHIYCSIHVGMNLTVTVQ